ncbi:MAG TPA: hypothetical protein VEH27_12070 [Methylomirabilota bacterium]|nr:hypothetical protein [Methylomirabilota bacterium]
MSKQTAGTNKVFVQYELPLWAVEALEAIARARKKPIPEVLEEIISEAAERRRR